MPFHKSSAVPSTVLGVALAALMAICGAMPAHALDAGAPSPEVTASANPSPEPSEATPSIPDRVEPPVPDTDQTESASRRAQSPSAAVSTNLPTVRIELPAGYGLDRLNASKDKVPADPKTEPHSKLTIDDSSNSLLDVGVEEIKTRGNFTSTLEKKPYQIKFDSSTSVLGMPEAKTWILLANHADPSLMRNKVALDLAGQFGMPGSPDARFVDLNINGEYQGNYLITEKVEVKKNRLDLTNPGGLLLELDNSYGADEDFNFTTTTSGSTFVLKDAVQKIADPLPTELSAAYGDSQDYLNRLEALMYAPDPDWAQISSMIDVDSFIEYYFVLEFSENPDAVLSSVYFWRDGPDDVLHAGPAWDFDIGFGRFISDTMGGDPRQDDAKNARALRGVGTAYFQELSRNPEFVQRANELYSAQLRPAVDTVLQRFDADTAALTASSEANFARWPNVLGKPALFAGAYPIASTWTGEISALRQWLKERVDYLDSAYASDMPVLTYRSHSAQIGWKSARTGGQIAGTLGQGLQMEALDIGLIPGATGGAIQSRGHVQNIGWTPWAAGDSTVGTTGRGLRLEAVEFSLTARMAADFDLEYRAHVQNLGWMPWVANGEIAGTTGQGLRVEAVQVRLLRKTVPTSGTSIFYSTHLSQVGWSGAVADGAESGAVGQGLSLEALEASLVSSEYDGTLSFRSHVQDIGWSDWSQAPGPIGTEGRGLRMEAFQLRLDGDIAAHYRVRYRAYVQDAGWQQWVTGGQTAGTTGQGRRVEAVQIEVTPKV